MVVFHMLCRIARSARVNVSGSVMCAVHVYAEPVSRMALHL